MDNVHPPLTSVQFGDFELSAESGELTKRGIRVRLSGQAFDTLVLLVAARGRVVSREELQKALWSESSFGDFEHGLNAAINRLRGTLGDSATDSKFIETVPRRGYRFIHPVVEVSDEKPAPEVFDAAAETSPPKAAGNGREVRLLWFAVPLVLLTVAGGIWMYLVRRSAVVPADVKETPLTTLPGSEISPTFSPDGSQIGFGWDGENGGAGYDLYVETLGTVNPHRLTFDPIQPWMSAAWSPDGRYIAIRAGGRDSATIQLIPATGGPGRPVTALRGDFHFTGLLSWSRDSKTIAFVEDMKRPHVELVLAGLYFLDLDTLQPRFVETGCSAPVYPRYSPQGDSLAFLCVDRMGRTSIEMLHIGSGTVDKIFEVRGDISGLDWSPDGRFLYYSHSDSRGDSYIWKMEVDHPAHRWRLPFAHDAFGLATSRDGDRLAYVQSTSSTNIWKLNLSQHATAESLIASTRRQNNPNISPDGLKVAFESDRGGSGEVWISDFDGHNLQQVTHFDSLTGTPRWSPDSRYLALDSRAEGKANIYIYDTMGGGLRKLNTSTQHNSLPSWSVDGRFLFYASGEDIDVSSIWRVPVEGGRATKIVENGDLPIPSPDGAHVFFRRLQLGSINIMRVRADGSDLQTISVLPEADSSVAWWPYGNGLYILSAPAGKDRIEYLDLATGKRQAIYTLQKPGPAWVGGLSISSDGKWLLFTQVDEQRADLYLLSGLNTFEQH